MVLEGRRIIRALSPHIQLRSWQKCSRQAHLWASLGATQPLLLRQAWTVALQREVKSTPTVSSSCGKSKLDVVREPLFRMLCHCTLCQKFNPVPLADIAIFVVGMCLCTIQQPSTTSVFANHPPLIAVPGKPACKQWSRCSSCQLWTLHFTVNEMPGHHRREHLVLPKPLAGHREEVVAHQNKIRCIPRQEATQSFLGVTGIRSVFSKQ